MIEIETLVVTPIVQNARILGCPATREAVVVDPGGEAHRIIQALQNGRWNLREIWLTHAHLDHCGGVQALKKATGVPLLAHPAEEMLRKNVQRICEAYGIEDSGMQDCPEPERPISGGEELAFGDARFKVLFTPGHSPGHLAFYAPKEQLLIAGDTVFAGAIGRTDIPGGNYKQLMDSINQVIMTLPDETRIAPGHGPDTTVGVERVRNPFLIG